MIAAVTCLCVSLDTHASDAFIPGDSYFLSCLDANMSYCDVNPEKNKEENTVRFQYRPAKQWSDMGGHAGYQYLDVVGMNLGDFSTLKKMYAHLRMRLEYPKIVEYVRAFDGSEDIRELEVNPFYLLIYNSIISFTPDSMSIDCACDSCPRVGLLYNENWMIGGDDTGPRGAGQYRKEREDRMSKPGHLTDPIYRDFGTYRSLLSSTEAMAEDWRDAVRFPGLNVKGMDSARARQVRSSWIEDNLTVTADSIQFVIIAPDDIDDVFRGVRGAVYLINQGKVYEMRWKRYECEVKELYLNIGSKGQ